LSKPIHIVSILDRSGSMGGTEVEVINAYNAFIAEQKQLACNKDIKIKTSLILFDNQYEEVYLKVPVEQTPELTKDTYFVRGMTAYFDALGKAINSFEGKPKVIFFIETDGHENASREFNANSIKQLVNKKKSEGWDFNFVGADLDSATVATLGASLGIDSSKTLSFNKTSQGYATRNAAFTSAVAAYADNN
jgi:hypothetical protein